MEPLNIPTPTAAIAFEGLTKRNGDLTAVDDLSFTVRAGAVTGFLGPDGAGRTMALKTIVGLARPTAGRILINGLPSGQRAPDARALGVYIQPCGAHLGRTARDQAPQSHQHVREARGRQLLALRIIQPG